MKHEIIICAKNFDLDQNPIIVGVGDTVDFGKSLLVWYDEPEATAMRILMKANQKKVRDAIQFTEERLNDLQHGRAGIPETDKPS